MSNNNDGLTEYMGSDLGDVADLLAEAWMWVEYNTDDGLGPDNVNPEWSKMVIRSLRGWAEQHERPRHHPWELPEFDGFRWASRL